VIYIKNILKENASFLRIFLLQLQLKLLNKLLNTQQTKVEQTK